MKLKYFLRGLGTGIILTALILCISYRSGKADEKSVVDQAKELGMVFPEGTQPPDEFPEESQQPEETPKGSQQPEETPQDTQQPEDTQRPEDDPEKTKPPAASKSGNKDKASSGAGVTGTEETIKFEVRDGLPSSTVACEMKEAGIIQNDKKFDEYLEDNGYSKNVKEGIYHIPKGASYSEIAKIITKQK